jgi:hypothetical protein
MCREDFYFVDRFHDSALHGDRCTTGDLNATADWQIIPTVDATSGGIKTNMITN